MSNTIGIDVGGTSLRAAVVNPQGRILDRERVPTPGSAHALEDAIEHVVRRPSSGTTYRQWAWPWPAF